MVDSNMIRERLNDALPTGPFCAGSSPGKSGSGPRRVDLIVFDFIASLTYSSVTPICDLLKFEGLWLVQN